MSASYTQIWRGSSCPLSHQFKTTGDEQLKPAPGRCSEQIHEQLFCCSVEPACLPMASAMRGCVESRGRISKLGCLKIPIRANIFKANWHPSWGLLLTTQFCPFEVAQLGYPGPIATPSKSWVYSNIWEIWYLSIFILSSRCCELPNVLSDVLLYLHFALKSIGIDSVWHLQPCLLTAVCK